MSLYHPKTPHFVLFDAILADFVQEVIMLSSRAISPGFSRYISATVVNVAHLVKNPTTEIPQKAKVEVPTCGHDVIHRSVVGYVPASTSKLFGKNLLY